MKYGKVYFEDVQVGDELPHLVKGPIQQIQLTRYAGASGDFNPIHQDHEFAKAAGMTVRAKATLLETDGKRFLFAVEAWDDKEKIAEGRHERYLVGDMAKFMNRAMRKR